MSETTGYPSTLTPDEVERLRRWHENAYAEAMAAGHQSVDFLGLRLEVPPGVQPINPMSDLLGGAVLAEVRPTDRVLDMGTGSGVDAILAARTSPDVVAVDVNPTAIGAARDNASRNGVADRVDVRESDLFTAVDGDFDLIVFDPPFRWFAPRDMFERASTDANYATLTRFFREAGGYLRPGGRMLISFGSSGDIGYLRRLMTEAGFEYGTVAHRDLVKDGMTVDYYTYRLTRARG